MNTAFTNPLIVVVKDAGGNPVSGATVTFSAPGTGASATFSAPAVTGPNGQTQVPATPNAPAGTYTVNATVGSFTTSPGFSLTNTAGAAASITVVTGTPQ